VYGYEKPQLHPFLRVGQMRLDMTEPLLLAQIREMGLDTSALDVLSTNAFGMVMNLHCHDFPWVFQLRKKTGITVDHVLEKIHSELREPLRDNELDDKQIQAADAERRLRIRGQIIDQFNKHILRIDFLKGKTMFVGLQPLLDQGPADWLMVFHYPPER